MKYINLILFFFTILNSGKINSQSWVQVGSDIDGEAAADLFGRSLASSNNGSISISSSQQENFIAYLNQNLNTQKQFTSNTTFDNLSSGIYELCIALSEFPKVKQCFTVRVKQPADLLVSSSVNAISYTISFELNGANKYYIKLNDKYIPAR